MFFFIFFFDRFQQLNNHWGFSRKLFKKYLKFLF